MTGAILVWLFWIPALILWFKLYSWLMDRGPATRFVLLVVYILLFVNSLVNDSIMWQIAYAILVLFHFDLWVKMLQERNNKQDPLV